MWKLYALSSLTKWWRIYASTGNRCGTQLNFFMCTQAWRLSGQPKRVYLHEHDFIFTPALMPVSLTLYFFPHLPKKEPVQYHTDQQGMPSQLCCIRRTVSEKWDVKYLSTASVNMHSAFAWHKNTLCAMQLITIPAHHWIKAKNKINKNRKKSFN